MAKYSDGFKASALVMMESQGYPDTKTACKAVATHLGVPDRTLRRWWKDEYGAPSDKTVQEKKEELKAILEDLLYKFAEHMTDAAEDAPLNHLAVSFGVVFDKLQNLKGNPNERIQHDITITDVERVQRLNELFDAARARRDGHAPDGDASMVLH